MKTQQVGFLLLVTLAPSELSEPHLGCERMASRPWSWGVGGGGLGYFAEGTPMPKAPHSGASWAFYPWSNTGAPGPLRFSGTSPVWYTVHLPGAAYHGAAALAPDGASGGLGCDGVGWGGGGGAVLSTYGRGPAQGALEGGRGDPARGDTPPAPLRPAGLPKVGALALSGTAVSLRSGGVYSPAHIPAPP